MPNMSTFVGHMLMPSKSCSADEEVLLLVVVVVAVVVVDVVDVFVVFCGCGCLLFSFGESLGMLAGDFLSDSLALMELLEGEL